MADYSQELQAAVRKGLDELEWDYTWDEENARFQYSAYMHSRIRSVQCSILVRENYFSVYTVCPLSADDDDPKQMNRMAEFITRANYGLPLGNFEFDFRDGEIRYKFTVYCRGTLPAEEAVEGAIQTPLRTMERYADGIVKVLYEMQTPEEAIKECESAPSPLERLLQQLRAREASGEGHEDAEDSGDDDEHEDADDEDADDEDDDGDEDEDEDEDEDGDGDFDVDSLLRNLLNDSDSDTGDGPSD